MTSKEKVMKLALQEVSKRGIGRAARAEAEGLTEAIMLCFDSQPKTTEIYEQELERASTEIRQLKLSLGESYVKLAEQARSLSGEPPKDSDELPIHTV
jgi:hypothetical protein